MPAQTMRLDQILAELDETEAKRLREVLASPAANTDVAATLTRHGYPIGEASVRRWKAARELSTR